MCIHVYVDITYILTYIQIWGLKDSFQSGCWSESIFIPCLSFPTHPNFGFKGLFCCKGIYKFLFSPPLLITSHPNLDSFFQILCLMTKKKIPVYLYVDICKIQVHIGINCKMFFWNPISSGLVLLRNYSLV